MAYNELVTELENLKPGEYQPWLQALTKALDEGYASAAQHELLRVVVRAREHARQLAFPRATLDDIVYNKVLFDHVLGYAGVTDLGSTVILAVRPQWVDKARGERQATGGSEWHELCHMGYQLSEYEFGLIREAAWAEAMEEAGRAMRRAEARDRSWPRNRALRYYDDELSSESDGWGIGF